MAAFHADPWGFPNQFSCPSAPTRPPSACQPVFGAPTQPPRGAAVLHGPWLGELPTCQSLSVPDIALVPEIPTPCAGFNTMAISQKISPPPLKCTLPTPFMDQTPLPGLVCLNTSPPPLFDRLNYAQGSDSFCESHAQQGGASSGGSVVSVNMGECPLADHYLSHALQFVETSLTPQAFQLPGGPRLLLLPQTIGSVCAPSHAPMAVVSYLPCSQGVGAKAQSEDIGISSTPAVHLTSRSHSVEVMSRAVKEVPDNFAATSQEHEVRSRGGRFVKVVNTSNSVDKPVKVIGAGMKRRPEGYDRPPPQLRVQRQRMDFNEKSVPQGTARAQPSAVAWGKACPALSHPPVQDLNPQLLLQDLPRQPSSLLPQSTAPVPPVQNLLRAMTPPQRVYPYLGNLPPANLVQVRAATPPGRVYQFGPVSAPAGIEESTTWPPPPLLLQQPITALSSNGIHVHPMPREELLEGLPAAVAISAPISLRPGAPCLSAAALGPSGVTGGGGELLGPSGVAGGGGLPMAVPPALAGQSRSAVADVEVPQGSGVTPCFFPARKLADVSLAARVLRRHVDRARWLHEVAGEPQPQPAEGATCRPRPWAQP